MGLIAGRKDRRLAYIVPALLLPAFTPASSLLAQDTDVQVDFLPLAEEVALALSAAPEHLRDGAAVFALTPAGFVEAQRGTNGFACVVNRDHPRNRKPTCYDAEGIGAILPKVLLVGELIAKGFSMAAINDSVEAGFASGRFWAPTRPGVAYMLSRGIRTYNPRNGSYGTFPPHMMFYAPNMKNADIGVSRDARAGQPWLPFIAYQGPHGFMVVMVPDEDVPGL